MFSHLHNHFVGSLSDSALRIDDGVKKAKSLGQNAIATTDHGEMPFLYEFADACKKYDVKPIFGVEVYFVDNAQRSIEKKDKSRTHLVLFAKNDIGYKNLVSMVSDSWLINDYYEQRGLVDWELLEKYSEGLIGSSACFFNEASQLYIKKDFACAEKVFRRYKDIFCDDFYIEIGKHGIADEEISNKGLLELAKKYDVKAIATNDVHYTEIDDWLVHDIIIKTRFNKITSFKTNCNHYWLKSEKEMLDAGMLQEFLDNTQEIVDKCDFVLHDFKPVEYKTIELIENEIKRGNAAYLSDLEFIERDKAIYYIESIIGKEHPDVAHYSSKVAGIPRRHKINTNKIAYLPNIKEKIPLKILRGSVTVQFTERACCRAGASVQPTVASPLSEALLKIVQ